MYAFISSAKRASFTWIFSKLGFNRSRRMVDVLSISPNNLNGGWAVFSKPYMVSQRATKSWISRSRSATFFPSATVRTMIPKLRGLILIARRFKRWRSAELFIFWEIETTSEKGTRTTYLPANDNSEVIRGPFVLIGSFAICTMIGTLADTTWDILPALLISSSLAKLVSNVSGWPPLVTIRIYFSKEWICGPRSR